MSTKVFNMRDWDRGTNPPIELRVRDKKTQQPASLINSVVVMVIRQESWEDSLSDENAEVKKRVALFLVTTEAELASITGMNDGDMCWIDDINSVAVYGLDGWYPGNIEENNLMQGQVTLRFTREEMMLPVGKHYYSIDIMNSEGIVSKLAKGVIRITSNTVNEI